jgi:pseudaminic acid synthase
MTNAATDNHTPRAFGRGGTFIHIGRMSMIIAGRTIGPKQPPYVIAEASCNHGGSLQVCYDLIRKAKEAGADAIKFQAYTADTITLDSDRPEFLIQDGPWKGHRLYDLYKETETPFEWFPQIKAWADEIGITWFASVFDKSSVDLMVKLDAPAIKIASFEITDLPLIKYAAKTGKPLIISTGMADVEDVHSALSAVGDGDCAFLHCVSAYPTPISESNLWRLCTFDTDTLPWGLSDHTLGDIIPIAATAIGTQIIEKHFRLPYLFSHDMEFSMTPHAFLKMTRAVRDTWAAMQPSMSAAEEAHRPYRRSLFAVKDINAGEMLTEDNVRSIRPGHGLPPATCWDRGDATAARNIRRGEPLDFDMIALKF